MTIKIDARGLACPGPVIRTKEVMEKFPEEIVVTLVDNQAAKENISRLAKKFGYLVTVTETDSDFQVTMEKDITSCSLDADESMNSAETVYFIASDRLGEGGDALGEVLMKSFFYALAQTKPYPQAIVLMNGGVRLSSEGSEVLEHIQLLEQAGVEILSCGTCLDYFGLKEKLQVGSISNMYTILETLNGAGKVIRI